MSIKKSHAPWYKVRASSEGKSEILIYGRIGSSYWDDESVTAKALIKELNEIGDDDIIVRINSIGGSVSDGIAIFNSLRRHTGEVTTSIEGVAYSAGSLIAMSGASIEMAENSMMMIHAPASYASGNSVEMRRQADMLDKYAEAMTISYVRKGGPKKEELEDWLKDGKDHYFTALEASENGLIDEITNQVDMTACSIGMDFTGYIPPKSQSLSPLTEVPDMALNTTINTPNPKEPPPVVINPVVINPDASGDEDTHDVAGAIATRNVEIHAVLDPLKDIEGINSLLVSSLSDVKMSVEAVRQSALDLLGKKATSLSSPIFITEDAADKRIVAVGEVLSSRCNLKPADGKPINLGSNPHRGMTLIEMARESLSVAGVSCSGMNKLEVVGMAFSNSSSDFPILLENVMHKSLQTSYAIAPDTWTRFCSIGSVSDFRAHNRYKLGSLSNLKPLNEAGEFENQDIPDGKKESVSIDTKGNLISITRQAIINDDLGSFVGLAASLGRAAKRTIETDVYDALKLNSGMGPTLNDDLPLFDAAHGNIASLHVGLPSVTTFEEASTLMAKQMDISKKDYLDLMASIWLGSISRKTGVKVLNASTYDPGATSGTKNQFTPNPYSGFLNDIIGTPRLDDAPWYLFADPLIAPVLEVSFLDANQEPFLDLHNGWAVDGAQYKVRLDFGIDGVGYEGAVRNPGV